MRKSFLFLLAFFICFVKAYNKELVFFDKRGTVYIAEKYVNIYEKPTTNSKVVLTLGVAESVYVLSNTNIMLAKGEIEEWYFVNTGMSIDIKLNSPTLKGWVQRENLAGKNDFRRQTKTREMFIMAIYSDFSVYYYININGSVKYLDESNVPKEVRKGSLYSYKKIISLDFYDFFYYDENNNLRSRWATELEVLTNKSDFPPWAQSDVPPVLEGDFAILTGDNVNIRTKPTTNSAVLTRLKKGARVKVLEISDEMFRMGEREGFWVYVETDEKDKQGKLIRGWMVDIYLEPEE